MQAPTPDPKATASGLTCMMLSCVFFAVMGALVYRVQLVEPDASVLVTSFVRIVVNLAILVVPAVAAGRWRELRGDSRPSLWARGFFGSLALMCSFASIRAIGIGESSFLHASNGVFVAAMAPIFLRQKNSAKAWVAIGGACIGLYLLFEPRLGDIHPWGRALALASGLFSALAYMMIARAGRSNPPHSVVFYFCLVAFAMHLVAFLFVDITWPTEPFTYLLMFGAGAVASVAQVFLTKAYQLAPAALNSSVSYLLPVLNMLASVVFFAMHPDGKAVVGAMIVLVFGVALPFVRWPAHVRLKPHP